jgi:small subunit ribosomal protein S16
MLTIRFIRIGKKNQPFFRLVVTDKKNPPRGGKFLEIVGHFNPLSKEKVLQKERIAYWISVGAKPSPRVHNLLVGEGIVKGKKIAVHSKPKKTEVKEEVKITKVG